jgi:hypothetical protein
VLVATQGAAITAVPRYVVALPFVGTILLLLVGQVLAWYIANQFGSFVTGELRGSDNILELLPSKLGPRALQLRFELSVDLIQAVPTVLTPAFGIAFLRLANLNDSGVLYFLAVPCVTLIVVFCLLNMTPGQYRRWGKPSRAQYRLSLITWSGLVLNVVAAVIAYTTSTWVSKGFPDLLK